MTKQSKLYKTKAVPVEEYTTLELAYLLFDVCRELDKREKAATNGLDWLNKHTYELTHEIELEEAENKTEKLKRYDALEHHLKTRRLLKQEHLVFKDIFERIDFDAHKWLSKLGQPIKQKQAYFQLEDGEKMVQPKEWRTFYERTFDTFM